MFEKIYKFLIFIPITLIFIPCFLVVNALTKYWSELLKDLFGL